MRIGITVLILLAGLAGLPAAAAEGRAAPGPSGVSERVQTPYKAQKVVYDFYFDMPGKIGAALYWLRAHIKPLGEAPYNIPPEFLDIKVVIHGTEIVTVARKNYEE